MSKKRGDAALMPITSPATRKRSKEPMMNTSQSDPGFTYTWGELEATKARLCTKMDLVEFLASSRNRLTDMKADQAAEIERTLRSAKKADEKVKLHLGRSIDNVGKLFVDHGGLMRKSRTSWKRLEAINTYVVNEETHRSGKQCGEAAKRSSRGVQPRPDEYPLYTDLHNRRCHEQGRPREQPMMAVTASMPYSPPVAALPRKLRGGGGSTTFDSTRSLNA